MVECSIHIIGNNNIVDSPPLLSNIAYNTVDPPPPISPLSVYWRKNGDIGKGVIYNFITKKKKIRVLKISGGIGGGSQRRGGIEGTTVDCIYHQHLEYIH